METEIILKKKGVQLARKRMKEFLKPLGFRMRPHSTNRFVRVRESFIDEIYLDATGYHLNPCYYIYSHFAPFAWLQCDEGRLWRAAKDDISTHLRWRCKIPPEGGPSYYMPEHFEGVWQDVSYVLEHHILPQMEAMTMEKFLSRMVEYNADSQDFFHPHRIVSFTHSFYPCMPEATVYGVGMWQLEKYEEGIPYLTFAQGRYRSRQKAHEQGEVSFSNWEALILALIDELLFLWEKKEENWCSIAQERIRQVGTDWINYIH